MPTMPPTPRPALVLNLSLPMVKGGKIIPQPLWMESQLKDYAQQYAQQFERAAASLALDRADLTAHSDAQALIDRGAALAADRAARVPVPVPVLTDELAAERERLCAAIKAADDKASEGDYMLDSDDCISVIRGTWNPVGLAAATQGSKP